MRIVKHLFCLAIIISSAICTYAVPAKPGLSKRTLPDGTVINVRLVGDEKSHYWLSEDNHLIIPDDNGYFVYANIENGVCSSSSTRVSPLALRSSKERNFVASLDATNIMQALKKQQEKAIKRAPRKIGWTPTYPTTGAQRAIVVLVQYQDVKFSVDNTLESFSNMLNQEGYSDNNGTGSARDWFIDNSCGQFTPSFDVFGPITLAHNRAYYGDNDSSGDDMLAYEMVTEACKQLDDEVDFTVYDRDNNGTIDNVYIFFAGYGENLGGDATADMVWPHSDDISRITSNIYTFDGVRLDHYACSNELTLANRQEGIGTFVHEFSHVLGLPDLYATNYSYAFTPGE